MNILTHNLIIQMRMLKKAKEKRTPFSSSSVSLLNKSSGTLASSNNSTSTNSPFSQAHASRMLAAQSLASLNEANLIEVFYELEAEIEKGACRDIITFNSAEKEHGTRHI